MAQPVEVGDKDFEERVLRSNLPVLVDFWAPWCGPCRMVAPIVAELSGEYEGRVNFTKLNVDDNPQVSARYGIRSIPTLLIFKDGKPIRQVVGYQPKAQLKKHLEDVLA